MKQTESSLSEIIRKSKSFTVKKEGKFYPLISMEEPTEAKIFYVEFFGIPAHYHRKTEERLEILQGRGVMELSYLQYLNQKFWNEMPKETLDITPGDVVDIPANTPHRMVVDPCHEYVGAILTCKPPLDPKDVFKIKMNEKLNNKPRHFAPSMDGGSLFL